MLLLLQFEVHYRSMYMETKTVHTAMNQVAQPQQGIRMRTCKSRSNQSVFKGVFFLFHYRGLVNMRNSRSSQTCISYCFITLL